MDEKKRLLVLHGHESTVCSVVADEHKIVSGGADKARLAWRVLFCRVDSYLFLRSEMKATKKWYTASGA